MCIFSLSLSWSMLFTSLSVIILGAALVIKIEGNKPFVSIYSDWRFDFKKFSLILFSSFCYLFFTVFSLDFGLSIKTMELVFKDDATLFNYSICVSSYWLCTKKMDTYFWLLCIACLFYTSLFIVKDYIFNGDKVNQMIMKGGAITTPISHIRYSLIVACVIIILLDWIIKKSIVKYEYEKWVYILLFLYFLDLYIC